MSSLWEFLAKDWLLNRHRQKLKGMQVSTTSVQGCMPA
jgi:hypothetical protein